MSPSSAIGWISIQETKYISFVHFCSRRKRSDYDRVWRRNLRCRAYCDRRTGRPWNLPFPDGKRRAASTPCSDSFLVFPPDVSDLNTRQILLTSPSFYDKNKEDVGGTEGLILTASDVNAPAPRIVHRGLCVLFFFLSFPNMSKWLWFLWCILLRHPQGSKSSDSFQRLFGSAVIQQGRSDSMFLT